MASLMNLEKKTFNGRNRGGFCATYEEKKGTVMGEPTPIS